MQTQPEPLQPPLRLLNSFVTRLHVEPNPAYDESKGAGRTRTNVELAPEPQPKKPWLVQLRIQVEDSPEQPSTAPYHIDLIVIGAFRCQPQETFDATAKLLTVTGASILYSAMREYLLLLTSRGPWGSFALPTIRFDPARIVPAAEAAAAMPTPDDSAEVKEPPPTSARRQKPKGQARRRRESVGNRKAGRGARPEKG